MRSPARALQTEYYRLLNGNITVDGFILPVYDFVPASPTYPYIELSTVTDVDWSDKSRQGSQFTFSLSVVDRFDASPGSRVKVYDATNQITKIIASRPNQVNLSASDYNVITSVLDNLLSRKELTDTYQYYVNELRFRHYIEDVQLVDTFDLTFDETFL